MRKAAEILHGSRPDMMLSSYSDVLQYKHLPFLGNFADSANPNITKPAPYYGLGFFSGRLWQAVPVTSSVYLDTSSRFHSLCPTPRNRYRQLPVQTSSSYWSFLVFVTRPNYGWPHLRELSHPESQGLWGLTRVCRTLGPPARICMYSNSPPLSN